MNIVVDTNVLFGATVRELILLMAQQQFFRPHWNEQIVSELSYLLPAYQLPKEYLVPGTFQSPVALPDPDDGPILALAQHLSAKVILTHNLKDFPQALLGNIRAMEPDEFFLELKGQYPIQDVLRLHADKVEWQDYVERLNRARLHKLSRALKN